MASGSATSSITVRLEMLQVKQVVLQPGVAVSQSRKEFSVLGDPLYD